MGSSKTEEVNHRLSDILPAHMISAHCGLLLSLFQKHFADSSPSGQSQKAVVQLKNVMIKTLLSSICNTAQHSSGHQGNNCVCMCVCMYTFMASLLSLTYRVSEWGSGWSSLWNKPLKACLRFTTCVFLLGYVLFMSGFM